MNPFISDLLGTLVPSPCVHRPSSILGFSDTQAKKMRGRPGSRENIGTQRVTSVISGLPEVHEEKHYRNIQATTSGPDSNGHQVIAFARQGPVGNTWSWEMKAGLYSCHHDHWKIA